MERKTKIICTIGPACSSPQTLAAMAEAGMDVARLNFSHGTHEEHREVIRGLGQVREETGRNIGILQDLSGPKIRTGALPESGLMLESGGPALLVPISTDGDRPPDGGGPSWEAPAAGAAEPAGVPVRVPVGYPSLLRDVPAGARILLDDGRIELRAEGREGDGLACRVITGGVLLPHKGVNFPDLTLSARAPTSKDLDDLRFGLEEGVDFVALSFVQTEEDMLELRQRVRALSPGTRIIAKLERKVALEHLDGILSASDGVMVARGDLGVEAELAMIPIYQKQIIRRANLQRVAAITATQMLESMIHSPSPTRAEVTDVANAIYDGSDAIMLSGETAVGLYPVAAVRIMRRVADHVEANLGLDRSWFHEESEYRSYSGEAAVADAICASAQRLDARCILAFTLSGNTARLIAQNRPAVPIVALTSDPRTRRQLSLAWGVECILVPPFSEEFLQTIREAERVLLERGRVREGDLVIVSAGIPSSTPGGTNVMKLHRIGGEHPPLREPAPRVES